MRRHQPMRLAAILVPALFVLAGVAALRRLPAEIPVAAESALRGQPVPVPSLPAPAPSDEAPPRLGPSPSPTPVAPPPAPPPQPPPSPARRAVAPTRSLAAYRGLGAWVDLYDYSLRDRMDPIAAVDEMAVRGVDTLYLQTSRWNLAEDIHDANAVAAFVDRAHHHGIRVIGWYLPGFGDLERDIGRSLAVLGFRTRAGGRFDGFAPDIEDHREVGGDVARFNSGVAEYSRRLREAAGGRQTLAAIVPDARNNQRNPARWQGFPWHEIGHQYDLLMPMGYWSVTKGSRRCEVPYDAAAYMRELTAKTRTLVRLDRPLHLIGGIADCIGAQEVAAYVTAAKELGSVGGSLYDFATMQANPDRERLWEELGRLK